MNELNLLHSTCMSVITLGFSPVVHTSQKEICSICLPSLNLTGITGSENICGPSACDERTVIFWFDRQSIRDHLVSTGSDSHISKTLDGINSLSSVDFTGVGELHILDMCFPDSEKEVGYTKAIVLCEYYQCINPNNCSSGKLGPQISVDLLEHFWVKHIDLKALILKRGEYGSMGCRATLCTELNQVQVLQKMKLLDAIAVLYVISSNFGYLCQLIRAFLLLTFCLKHNSYLNRYYLVSFSGSVVSAKDYDCLISPLNMFMCAYDVNMLTPKLLLHLPWRVILVMDDSGFRLHSSLKKCIFSMIDEHYNFEETGKPISSVTPVFINGAHHHVPADFISPLEFDQKYPVVKTTLAAVPERPKRNNSVIYGVVIRVEKMVDINKEGGDLRVWPWGLESPVVEITLDS
ncbi:hypothetical protein Anapl_17839 [Anas platyrhynchos]|uniref:Uncharacterized protein n=1 Tax=Anas platyrhynchos TaxID=8839 RepID=R0JET3_ANAPL|nr:hypothetical protein Anapl_17839 [Anas platyrhynchos]